jgi:hypothetical protein
MNELTALDSLLPDDDTPTRTQLDLPVAAGSRWAVNQIGFDVQVLSPFGWRATGFCKPYDTREVAGAAMRELRALDSMNREYRVYAALALVHTGPSN